MLLAFGFQEFSLLLKEDPKSQRKLKQLDIYLVITVFFEFFFS
jgi:hypothetical protein